MPADIVVQTSNEDRDEELDKKTGHFRKITAQCIDVLNFLIGQVFKEVPGIGVLTFLIGQGNSANKKDMDSSLDQYLHAVTTTIGREANRLTETIDKGFKQLDNQLAKTDYKQVVQNRTKILASHMKDVADASSENSDDEKIQVYVNDFLIECGKMPPIDVLYALYKRISKSRSDLNFIWKAIIKDNYHQNTFGPLKEQVQQTTVTLVLAHLLYISLEYANERNEEMMSSKDDDKEIHRLFKIARDINQCLDNIDTQQKEVWWPRIPELIVRREVPKGQDHGKTAEERIIFELTKLFGKRYDFIAIRFTPTAANYRERYEWKLETHKEVKSIEFDVGGTKCIVLRFAREVPVRGNPSSIIDDIWKQMEDARKDDTNL